MINYWIEKGKNKFVNYWLVNVSCKAVFRYKFKVSSVKDLKNGTLVVGLENLDWCRTKDSEELHEFIMDHFDITSNKIIPTKNKYIGYMKCFNVYGKLINSITCSDIKIINVEIFGKTSIEVTLSYNKMINHKHR